METVTYVCEMVKTHIKSQSLWIADGVDDLCFATDAIRAVIDLYLRCVRIFLNSLCCNIIL